MNWSDLLGVRVQAILAKGAAKDIDATQRKIDESDNPDVIVHALTKGKLKFKVKAKKNKLSEIVSDSIV